MDDFIKEMDLLIRSRYPMIYVLSFEEDRAEEILKNIGRDQKKKLYFWTSSRGFTTNYLEWDGVIEPMKALLNILDSREKAIFVLKDFHPFLDDNLNLRVLRDLARDLKERWQYPTY